MPTKKEQTRERIVRSAARAIRAKGYDGVGVAEVMKDAGLTHGGFYAHFASRDALLVEALDAAAGDALDGLGRVASQVPVPEAFDAMIDRYLSDAHVATPEGGCTLAALGTETRRQSPEVRQVATRRAKEMIDLIERQMPGWGEPGRHADAMAVMCSLVGAMVVARAVDDADLSKALRVAAARSARASMRSDRGKD